MALARGPGARVFVSIPFDDPATARALEPGTPAPRDRYETLRVLSEAGLTTGVAIAPLIPGLTESEVPRILTRAREAGAEAAFLVLLRLPAEVHGVFVERLREALPERADHVLSALDDVRRGRRRESRFGERMRGHGPRWEAVHRLFQVQCRRLGLRTDGGTPFPTRPPLPPARAPAPALRQSILFEETRRDARDTVSEPAVNPSDPAP